MGKAPCDQAVLARRAQLEPPQRPNWLRGEGGRRVWLSPTHLFCTALPLGTYVDSNRCGEVERSIQFLLLLGLLQLHDTIELPHL